MMFNDLAAEPPLCTAAIAQWDGSGNFPGVDFLFQLRVSIAEILLAFGLTNNLIRLQPFQLLHRVAPKEYSAAFPGSERD